MPKIKYVEFNFHGSSKVIIDRANEIIDDYRDQGFDLTLRQLYYQFVSRDWLPNKDSEYKRLGSIINDARLAGLIDWEAITDRTRNLRINSHWDSPQSILRSAAHGFAIDKWKGQEYRPEVFIEKDALVGILEAACKPLDVPYFSCRGYTGASELWQAAQRMQRYERDGQQPIVFHLGDHDPSGIDMSRDIEERLSLFGANIVFKRIALNMAQIRAYDPPPNPAKTTDARFLAYQKEHGDESWELDALSPTVLTNLIQGEILEIRDNDLWDQKVEEENDGKEKLLNVANNWNKLKDKL